MFSIMPGIQFSVHYSFLRYDPQRYDKRARGESVATFRVFPGRVVVM